MSRVATSHARMIGLAFTLAIAAALVVVWQGAGVAAAPVGQYPSAGEPGRTGSQAALSPTVTSNSGVLDADEPPELALPVPALPAVSPTALPSPSPGTVRFAVIGDYGTNQPSEGAVSALVNSWSPAFVITIGDNNYPDGAASTIDADIGQYYHQYIYPYVGSYGPGAPYNMFFPALGNHDWDTTGAQPYLNYFTLPNNERYYDFATGPVHFFMVDSDPHEPDGITSTSVQGAWVQRQIAAATEPWKVVAMHHPPYSSGATHGSTPALQWPYAAWGATTVLAGHEHNYERLSHDNIPYFVDGLGGNTGIYGFGTPLADSKVRYTGNWGALLCEATLEQFSCRFITVAGDVIDNYTLGATRGVLAGHVTWQGRPPQPAPANQLPITLTLQLGTNPPVSYPNQMTDASGIFTVPVDTLPTGVYTWWAKGATSLATSGTILVTNSAATVQELGVQRAGDGNNDNLVDITDFGLLRASFGKTCGDPGYDSRADFTGDCVVDVGDFALLRANFGQEGPPPPR